MESYQTILERKQEYYGKTEASYEFAAEEYAVKYNNKKNKELLEVFNKKFDEYHKKQMKIHNNQDPDFYLFMGKANAIGEAVDFLEFLIES
jgi:hypothetical protein